MFTRKLISTISVLAAIGLSAVSFAMLDTDILIQRALNSPDFSVRYSGVNAAMVELRLNGVSIGTKQVSPLKPSGEASFTLDLTALNDGDNVIEVRLYDKGGRLVGTQRMNVFADDGTPSPVKLHGLRQGQTVQGSVEIQAGFGRELRSAYVSFFVDEQFKAMTNTSPYSFIWDTIGETNGWHEVEAWVVDEKSTTFKTRKIRVYVNNPGGRTDRRVAPIVTNAVPPQVPVTSSGAIKSATGTVKSVPSIKPVTATAKAVTPVNTAIAPIKSATPAVKAAVPVATATAKAVASTAKTTVPVKGAAPIVKAANTVKTASVPNLQIATNGISAITSASVGFKAASGGTQTAGAKLVTPKVKSTNQINVSNSITTAKAVERIKIGYGTKLPASGKYSINLDGKEVKFDVQPWIDGGVPLSPLRHLLEAKSGKVDWEHLTKTFFGEVDGKKVVVKVGGRTATIDDLDVQLEREAFIEQGRTIVPLSFVSELLQVDVQYDPATGHVLITSVKKRS